MGKLTFTLEGSGGDGKTVICRGVDANGAETVIQTQARGTSDATLMQVAAEIARRGQILKRSARPLAFEYDTVTERQVPVLYCYPRDVPRAPVVFFNHGTSGNAVEQLFMGVPLAEAGFFTVLLDAWYHGRRRSRNWDQLFSGRLYKETYVKMLIGTCQDISRLLDHLRDDPRADVERAGITGISQGGFVSFMAITMEKRLKVAAPLIGSPDLEDRFGLCLPLSAHDPEVIELTVRNSPLRNCQKMPPTALLVQNGTEDDWVPVSGVRKLDEKLKDLYRATPERYQYIEYPSVGHNDQGMREPAIRWLAKHLGVETP